MKTPPLSRREFNVQALTSHLTFSFLETVFRHDLIADEVRPDAFRWLADVNQLGHDLKGQSLGQLAWQKKVEELLPIDSGSTDWPQGRQSLVWLGA